MNVKLNAALTERFCQLIRQGVTQERAAWTCGVDDATVWKWKHRGQVEEAGKYRDFWEAYRKALGESEVLALNVINKAATEGDWRAVAWRLERMNPDRFGQKIKVTNDERDKLAADLLARLRSRIDAGTFQRIEEAIVDACCHDGVDESD